MSELATAGQMQTADRSFFAQSDGRMDGRTGRRASGGRGRDEAINKVDVSRGMLSWGSVVFRRDGTDNLAADGAHDDNGHNLA